MPVSGPSGDVAVGGGPGAGAAGGDLAIAARAPGRPGGRAHPRGTGPLAAAAAALRDELRGSGGAHYAEAGRSRARSGYNRLKPFRLAWMLYLAAFLLLLASFPLASRRWAGPGSSCALLGAACATRTACAAHADLGARPRHEHVRDRGVRGLGRRAAGARLRGPLPRRCVAATCASGLAVVALILADNVPILDGSIAPLVPVLRDNMWLTLHVLTITLGYAAFFLAMGLGHLNLGLFFFAPGRAGAPEAALALPLSRRCRSARSSWPSGTLLGGVWADYSWGRFWGWDPKETWALIALLGYLARSTAALSAGSRTFGLAAGRRRLPARC